MYRAEVKMTKGWGLEVNTIVADSYKELKEKVEKVKALNGVVKGEGWGKKAYKIFAITYFYPSGKKFVEKI